MVGIRKRRTGDLPRAFPAVVVLVNQQPHKFGHTECRVCIVDMHSDLIGQIIKCMVIFQMLIQNRLQRTRHQQILLAQAQALAVDMVVRRIENL